MAFNPMLAKSASQNQLGRLLTDDSWVAQQKLDGVRILVTVEDGVIRGVGRSGRAVDLDLDSLRPLTQLSGVWRFDGEYTDHDEKLWLFDAPETGGVVTPNTPYEERYNALKTTIEFLFEANADVKVVDIAEGTEAKTKLLEWCESNRAEGVMFKNRHMKYLPGVRSPDQLKYKFVDTVDCVVLETRREGKESIAVGAFHNGVLTDIGSAKVTESQGLAELKPGDVVEIRYLYATRDLRLYQPVYLGKRTDKDPFECTTDQLKYTDKTVKTEF